MNRIGFVGVPGSGKTSTARVLAGMCRSIDGIQNIELIQEYARRYMAKYGEITDLFEQNRVLNKQLDWEDSVGNNVDLIITDSPVHLGWLYAQILRKIDDPRDVIYMNDLFKNMTKINTPHRYDIIFYLPPVHKPVDDGVRPAYNFDQEWREKASQEIKFIFKLFPPKHFIEVESVDILDRVQECIGHIKDNLYK